MTTRPQLHRSATEWMHRTRILSFDPGGALPSSSARRARPANPPGKAKIRPIRRHRAHPDLAAPAAQRPCDFSEDLFALAFRAAKASAARLEADLDQPAAAVAMQQPPGDLLLPPFPAPGIPLPQSLVVPSPPPTCPSRLSGPQGTPACPAHPARPTLTAA